MRSRKFCPPNNLLDRNLWFALYNGGPQTFAWSVVIVYAGALAQSASLAEMASIQPIAGAQYHWTYHLAPERWKRLITWMQGELRRTHHSAMY